MQVRSKYDFEIFGCERGDVLVAGGSSGAAHHSGAEVDKISGAIHDHRNRRSGTVRIDDGCAGAEDDELGVSVLGECGRYAENESCCEFERSEFHEALKEFNRPAMS